MIAAELDFGRNRLSNRFDPDMVGPEAAARTADRLAGELSFHRKRCPGNGGAHCATCALHLNAMLSGAGGCSWAPPGQRRWASGKRARW